MTAGQTTTEPLAVVVARLGGENTGTGLSQSRS